MMERQKVSKSIDGTSDLVVWAPIRQGFIDAFENITFETRLQQTADALHKIRVSAREYEPITPFPDTVQRILTLLNFRIGPIDRKLFLVKPQDRNSPEVTPRRFMYLAATFDGPLEPYMRLIWNPLGPFLDLLLCNCEDYVPAGDSSFDEYMTWVRNHTIQSSIFYSADGLTVKDHLYLTKLEKFQRADGCDRLIAGVTSDDPEALAADARAANKVQSDRLAIEALTVLYALADYYPPDRLDEPGGAVCDGRHLLRVAQDLLRGWEPALLPEVDQKIYYEPLSWFRRPRPASNMKTLDDGRFDRTEVQRALLKGHDEPGKPMTHGVLLLLQLVEPVSRDFLRWLEPTWDSSGEEEGPTGELASQYPAVSFDLAFTFEGLKRLGLAKASLDAFPKEFRDGMAERAPSFGDVQGNHPRRWPLPARYARPDRDTRRLPPVELTEIDVVLQLRTRRVPEEHGRGFVAFSKLKGPHGALAQPDPDDPNPLATLIALIADHGPKYGVRLLAVEDMVRGHEEPAPGTDIASTDPLAPPTTEHFGFRDGLSQPVLAEYESAPKLNEIRIGDLICGYRNSLGDYPAAPSSNFLRNGSFMVVRKMDQDVKGFQDLLKQYPEPFREDLAAHLVGRRRDGTPLINPAMGNDFNYSDDPNGEQCPLSAHIRLSNPRQCFQGRPAPRILRRGMSYGRRLKDDCAGKRGVVFIAYNASIAEQYEVIQRWLNRGNSTNVASAQNDPLTGTAIEPGPQVFRRIIGNKVHRIEIERPLVAVEWGAYFFVPSRTALKQLREPSPSNRYSVQEGEEILARLKTMSREAQRREWKVLLEDFLAKDPSEKNQTPQLWAAIRHHGGAYRVNSGIAFDYNVTVQDHFERNQEAVLVAAPGLISWVLSQHCSYSVYEQRRRAKQSFGDIYVAQDPQDGCANYLLESQETNEIIWRYSTTQQDDAYQAAYNYAEGVLNVGKAAAAGQGFSVMELELSREFFMPTLGQLCEYWFDIPDTEHEINLGGWGWAPVEGGKGLPGDVELRKPRCPGDFMAPSRYTFYPRPTERIQMYGKSHGAALRAASLKIVETMTEKNGAELKGKISRPMYKKIVKRIDLGAEKDLLARNLIGIMEGMLPPTEGILRGILYEWLDQKTLWRYQGALRHAASSPRATFEEAKDALRHAVEAAMCERPSPDLLYRTAIKADQLGEVEIKPGDLVILALVSATQAALEKGEPDIEPIFGGKRKCARQPMDEPAHACPAQGMVMASVLGIIAALLDSGRIQALPGSMIIRISDYVIPAS